MHGVRSELVREGNSAGTRQRNSAPAVNLLQRISEFITVEPLY